MPRPFPLRNLLRHAEHRMEAAERLLRMLRRREEAARQRLEEIRAYRLEYTRQLTGSGEAGMPIHLYRDYRLFMHKLDAAIQHQEKLVAEAQANWQAAHLKWLELRRQVKAYEVLGERHLQHERRVESRREQRATDELAAQGRQPLGGLDSAGGR